MTGIEYLKANSFSFMENASESDYIKLGQLFDKFAQIKLYELNPTINSSDIKGILAKEKRWLEVVSMQIKARSKDRLLKHIDKFIINAVSRGQENLLLIEWKKYFINWCKYNPIQEAGQKRSSHNGLTAN